MRDPSQSRRRALLTALHLRTGVRSYATRVLDAIGHAPLGAEPGNGGLVRTAVLGPAPIRVLVFGAGVAVGYGVRSRQDAADGPLADLLAERSGRGVVVENRAVEHVALPDTVASLGAVGTHTYDVAVWCPSFLEGLERLRPAGWRSQLHAMIRALRETERVPLVLTLMPVPEGRHPAALLARPWVHRLNRVIAQVADEYDAVESVAVEPFVPREVGQPVTDAAYFAATAARIAPVVAVLLRLPVRQAG